MNELTVRWPDAELQDVSADYDTVTLSFVEAGGDTVRIDCLGHIGYQRLGTWDEEIVERGNLADGGDCLSQCLEQLRLNPAARLDSGSPQRNTRRWRQLDIVFIDGSRLSVVAAEFRVVRGE